MRMSELVEKYREKFGEGPMIFELSESQATKAIDKAIKTGVPISTVPSDIGDDVDPQAYQR